MNWTFKAVRAQRCRPHSEDEIFSDFCNQLTWQLFLDLLLIFKISSEFPAVQAGVFWLTVKRFSGYRNKKQPILMFPPDDVRYFLLRQVQSK